MSNRDFRKFIKDLTLIIGLAYTKFLFFKKSLRRRLASRPALRRIHGKIRFTSLRASKKIKVHIQSGRGYFLFVFVFLGRHFTKNLKDYTRSSSLLLIFPADYNPVSANFNGGVKDIQSLQEQIDALKLPYEYVCLSRRQGHALYVLLNRANRQRIFSVSKIIISIPGSSGGILLFLRLLGLPNVIFRSHNAELLHRLDWLRSSRSIMSSIKAFRKMILGYTSDLILPPKK